MPYKFNPFTGTLDDVPASPVGDNSPVVTSSIGTPGAQGFGAGICPQVPAGMSTMSGTTDPASDNYGNYQVIADGSVMVYVPAFYYKVGTGANGLAVNAMDIKPVAAYSSVTSAAADGYAMHRAFYNGGVVRPGVFVDKYLCSNNGGIASSLKNGNPLSSAAANNPFSALNGARQTSAAAHCKPRKREVAAFFAVLCSSTKCWRY